MTRVLVSPGVVLVVSALALAGWWGLDETTGLLYVRGLDLAPVLHAAIATGLLVGAVLAVLIVYREDRPR